MTLDCTAPVFQLHVGTQPLLISVPHGGTHVPPVLAERLSPEARLLPDTDWHLDRLYEFAQELGASILLATHSRYVIDLNRPPDDHNLYPGQDTTGLCPIDTFDKHTLYAEGDEPTQAGVQQRIETFWRPYHQQLRAELQRLKTLHGSVLLWEAHSIRSVVPRFFQGTLPDLNLGTADGTSCRPGLGEHLLQVAHTSGHPQAVLNGRFKGGYITRHYGAPDQGLHAVQLEMTQNLYMQETPPFTYRPDLAAKVQPVLRRMLEEGLKTLGAPTAEPT